MPLTLTNIPHGVSGPRMTTKMQENARLDFLQKVVRYELDRQVTGGHNKITRPDPFSDWDVDIEKARIQKEYVKKFTKQVNSGKFID